MEELIIGEPIEADFNAQDTDGAVRLYLPLRLATTGKKIQLALVEQKKMWLTDGEVEVVGTISHRGNFWVVLPSESYKDVTEAASYYIKNQKRREG